MNEVLALLVVWLALLALTVIGFGLSMYAGVGDWPSFEVMSRFAAGAAVGWFLLMVLLLSTHL